MPDLDPNIALKVQPPQIDALGTATKALSLGQGLLQNRLLGQQVGAKEALGRAITGATDPATGETDWKGALGAMAQDPQGAFGVPELAGQVLDRRIKDLQLQGEDLKLAHERWTQVGNGATALLASKEPLTPEVVTQYLGANLVSSGLFKDPQSVGMLTNFVQALPADDAGIRKALTQAAIQSTATSERINAAMGPLAHSGLSAAEAATPTGVMVRNPDGTLTPSNVTREQFVQQAQGGPVAAAAPMSRSGLTGSDLTQRVTIKGPDGEDRVVTLGSLIGEDVPGAAGVSPGAAPPSGDGRYPGAGDAPLRQGGVATSLPPGAAEARVASAHDSAQVFQKDVTEAGGYAQRLQGLNKAYDNLQQATTGKGTKGVQNFGSVLNSFGIRTPTDVDKYAEAEKYLTDYAVRRGSDLGLGTDAARALVTAANPGVQTPKGAALAVVNVMKGLERMQASQVAAAQAEGVTPDQYTSWRAKWSRSVDPSAFVPEKLTKEGWEAKRKALGPKWDAYKRGLDSALAAGVLSPDDLRK